MQMLVLVLSRLAHLEIIGGTERLLLQVQYQGIKFATVEEYKVLYAIETNLTYIVH